MLIQFFTLAGSMRLEQNYAQKLWRRYRVWMNALPTNVNRAVWRSSALSSIVNCKQQMQAVCAKAYVIYWFFGARKNYQFETSVSYNITQIKVLCYYLILSHISEKFLKFFSEKIRFRGLSGSLITNMTLVF